MQLFPEPRRGMELQMQHQWQLESLRHIHQQQQQQQQQQQPHSVETDEVEDMSVKSSSPAVAYHHLVAAATPSFERKETARVSELGPRLAGYLEMNPLFLVRREDATTIAAASGGAASPEVAIIPLSPQYEASPRPQATSVQLTSCCRSQRRLIVVPLFVLASVMVFVMTMYKNNCPATQTQYSRCILPGLKRFSFQPLVQNPLLGPSSQTLLDMGALESELAATGGQGWRLVTCIWLHAGIFHLLLNMLGLLSLGIQMENEFGFFKVGLIYVLSGFGGSLMSALFLRLAISVGASGALFGLMGALLSELLINWHQHERNWFLLSQVLILLIINLALGKMPHVDNFAHLGGCVCGFLLGLVLLQQPNVQWCQPASESPARGTVPAPGIPVQAQDLAANAPATMPRQLHEFDHQTLQLDTQQQQQRFPQQQRANMVSIPRYRFIVWVLALNLLVVLYVVALIMLFRGVDVRKKCKWCRQLQDPML